MKLPTGDLPFGVEQSRREDIFGRAVTRFGAVPKTTIRQSVKKRTKRGKKCWAVEFPHPFPHLCPTADKRVRKFVKDQTRAGAEAKAEELWRECYIQAELAVLQREPKVAEFIIETFWPRYPKKGKRGVLAPSTIRTYRNSLVLYILPRLGCYRFDEVTPLVLDDFLGGLLEDDELSAKYVYNIRGLVALIFKMAHVWQKTRRLIAVPSVSVPKRIPDFLTFGEKRKLLAVAVDKFECALFRFAMDTGARPAELVAARDSDIKWERGVVVIPRAYSAYTEFVIPELRDGAANVPMTPGYKLPKDEEPRDVPLSSSLRAALTCLGVREAGELLFPLSLDSLNARFQSALSRAGICQQGSARKLRAYDLRHTFASHLVLRGVPLRRGVDPVLSRSQLIR